MKIPYFSDKIKKIFNGENEMSVEEFKKLTPKLRLGGKEWLPFGRDLEDLGLIEIDGRKVRLKK